MQRSRHYNAWYCAWKACEKLEGLLALSQAIWPAGQEWESGLQEETQEAQRVRKSREEVEQVLYTVTKSVDFSNADVFVQAIVTPNLLVWKGPNGIYDVWIKRIKLLSIINTQRKWTFFLWGLRGSRWWEDLILLPLERRGPMWGGKPIRWQDMRAWGRMCN